MILSKELMDKAISRINELQQETIKKADAIKGSKDYVEQQMKLYEQAEIHRKSLNSIIHQQELLSKQFIK